MIIFDRTLLFFYRFSNASLNCIFVLFLHHLSLNIIEFCTFYLRLRERHYHWACTAVEVFIHIIFSIILEVAWTLRQNLHLLDHFGWHFSFFVLMIRVILWRITAAPFSTFIIVIAFLSTEKLLMYSIWRMALFHFLSPLLLSLEISQLPKTCEHEIIHFFESGRVWALTCCNYVVLLSTHY